MHQPILLWEVNDMEQFTQILPIIIMVESFAAAITLFIYQQYGSAIYWFAAGVLNCTVIFGIKQYG